MSVATAAGTAGADAAAAAAVGVAACVKVDIAADADPAVDALSAAARKPNLKSAADVTASAGVATEAAAAAVAVALHDRAICSAVSSDDERAAFERFVKCQVYGGVVYRGMYVKQQQPQQPQPQQPQPQPLQPKRGFDGGWHVVINCVWWYGVRVYRAVRTIDRSRSGGGDDTPVVRFQFVLEEYTGACITLADAQAQAQKWVQKHALVVLSRSLYAQVTTAPAGTALPASATEAQRAVTVDDAVPGDTALYGLSAAFADAVVNHPQTANAAAAAPADPDAAEPIERKRLMHWETFVTPDGREVAVVLEHTVHRMWKVSERAAAAAAGADAGGGGGAGVTIALLKKVDSSALLWQALDAYITDERLIPRYRTNAPPALGLAAVTKVEDVKSAADLHAGDCISVEGGSWNGLFAKAYTHHFVVLEDGGTLVAEYTGDDDAPAGDDHPFRVLIRPLHKTHPARRMKRLTFSHAFPLAVIAARAKSREREEFYHYRKCNCEHFVTWAVTGRSDSAQVTSWMHGLYRTSATLSPFTTALPAAAASFAAPAANAGATFLRHAFTAPKAAKAKTIMGLPADPLLRGAMHVANFVLIGVIEGVVYYTDVYTPTTAAAAAGEISHDEAKATLTLEAIASIGGVAGTLAGTVACTVLAPATLSAAAAVGALAAAGFVGRCIGRAMFHGVAVLVYHAVANANATD